MTYLAEQDRLQYVLGQTLKWKQLEMIYFQTMRSQVPIRILLIQSKVKGFHFNLQVQSRVPDKNQIRIS